jgi:hypothetical protein
MQWNFHDDTMLLFMVYDLKYSLPHASKMHCDISVGNLAFCFKRPFLAFGLRLWLATGQLDWSIFIAFLTF